MTALAVLTLLYEPVRKQDQCGNRTCVVSEGWYQVENISNVFNICPVLLSALFQWCCVSGEKTSLGLQKSVKKATLGSLFLLFYLALLNSVLCLWALLPTVKLWWPSTVKAWGRVPPLSKAIIRSSSEKPLGILSAYEEYMLLRTVTGLLWQ
jgi:hypothetical protein